MHPGSTDDSHGITAGDATRPTAIAITRGEWPAVRSGALTRRVGSRPTSDSTLAETTMSRLLPSEELFEVLEGVVDLEGTASQHDGSVHTNGRASCGAVAEAAVKPPRGIVALGAY